MSDSQAKPGNLLRASSLRAAGFAVATGFQFLTIILVGRYLGVAGFGLYSLIQAVIAIFQVLGEGARGVLVREISVHREDARSRVDAGSTLFGGLAIAAAAALLIRALASGQASDAFSAALLASVAVFLNVIAFTHMAVLRGFERMSLDMLGLSAHKVLLFGLTWLFLAQGRGIAGAFLALAVANLAQYLYFVTLSRRLSSKSGAKASRDAHWASVRGLLSEAWPLSSATFLRRFGGQADRLIIGAIAGETVVGIYASAYRFVEVLKPFILNITLPIFPRFSRLAQEGPKKVLTAQGRALHVLYAVMIPVAAGFAAWAEPIFRYSFGEKFLDAVPVMQALAPMMVLAPATTIYFFVFTALGAQRPYMLFAAVGLAINVALDFLLVPQSGAMGAVVAATSGEFAFLVTALVWLRSQGDRWSALTACWRPILAGVPLYFILARVSDGSIPQLLIGGVVGTLAYAVALLLLGFLRVVRRPPGGPGEPQEAAGELRKAA